jgi:hypothetical protein
MLLDRQPLCSELASDVSKSVRPSSSLSLSRQCAVLGASRASQQSFVRYVPNADRRYRTAQKPNEELLENFRASFPHLAHTTRSQSIGNPTGSSLTDALDVAHSGRYVLSSSSAPAPLVLLWPQCAIICTRAQPSNGIHAELPTIYRALLTSYLH